MNGNEVAITVNKAENIYNNIGKTEQVNVNVERNAKGQFINEGFDFKSW